MLMDRGFFIVPHNLRDDGLWTIPDDGMRAVFEKMQIHGLQKTVFADGHVQTPDQFVNYAKRKTNLFHVIYNRASMAPEMVAWLNDIGRNHACGHFCIFPEAWGEHTEHLGHMTLDYWFAFRSEDWPGLDVIIGRMPIWNIHAIDFVRRLGFTFAGKIPGIAYDHYNNRYADMALAYLRREDHG